MINNVVLVGRLTRDPELRKTQTGKSVLSFSCAVNRKFKTETQTADFINCVAWNQTADFLARYATKGALVGIEGRIQTRNYDDKTGNRVYVTEVVCDSVQLLESKAEAERRQSQQGSQGYAQGGGQSFSQGGGQSYYPDSSSNDLDEEFGGPTLDISSDDLPF
ncbi:MAG TPA: single-stranded DNA-binding protein [Erysipelotrichaceae bacterium]|nr:single-stranded DNA-binding protein [Erysipelotrichaceae bacterium]